MTLLFFIMLALYRAWQKNGSKFMRIFQAIPSRSGRQQEEQNSRNLGTVFFVVPCRADDKIHKSFPSCTNKILTPLP